MYFGKYRARVVDINDPEERGRIRVECPTVLGKSKSAWCETCVPVSYEEGGDFAVPPHLDDTVWVEFEGGDWNKPIWVGNWWSKEKSPVPKALELMENLSTYEDAVGMIRTIEWRGIRMTFAEDYSEGGEDKKYKDEFDEKRKWRFTFDMVNGENKTKFEVIHDGEKEYDNDTITLSTEHSVTVNIKGHKPEAILNMEGEETAEIKVNMESVDKTSIEIKGNSEKETDLDINLTSANKTSVGLNCQSDKSAHIDVKCIGESAVIDIESSKQINMKCEDFKLDASKTITANSGQTTNMSSGQSTTINGGSLIKETAARIELN